MQKNAPSLPRILAMVVFALSCFGLLLFLWLSFGGPIPLQAKRYVLKVNFPEATTLAQEADVRIAGVTVGKVTQKELNKGGNSTKVTLQIDPQYTPIAKDTRTILRQKTLLGETYVELTPGNKKLGTLKDGATLANGQVEPTVELDEILRIFDPATKKAFRQWVAESAQQIKNGGGQDLNSALGNLGDFAQSGAGVLSVLNTQHRALRSVIKNTGVVFAALNQRYGQLHDLIVNSHATFSATAAEQEALAQTFEIFPTFLDESKATLARLERFSINTHPLVNDLKPVADDLGPTISDLGKAAPDLETLFRRLKPVINASPRDLPAGGALPARGGAGVRRAARLPAAAQPDPLLRQLRLAGAGWLHRRRRGRPLLQAAAVLERRAALHARSVRRDQLQQHLDPHDPAPYDRGNGYQLANALKRGKVLGVVTESWSCNQAGGVQRDPVDTPMSDLPPCFVQPAHLWGHTMYPHVDKGRAPLVNSPTGPTPPPLPNYK